MAAAPLQGIRVVELGEGISAAYCAQLLGVLGAEVVKVEPLDGDVARRQGPFPDDLPDREKSGLFLYLNRGKRSLTIDIACATGRELLRGIVRESDVVVENFAPSHLSSLGLGYDTLAADNEAVVMTSITPFGQTGPYRGYSATEITLFALGGLMNLVGDIRREPLKLGGSPMLFSGGVFAFAATLVGLHLAEATGVGEHVDVSIMEAIASSHFQDLVDYEYQGLVRRRGELRTPIPCKDGLISFTVQAHQWPDFRRLILGDAGDSSDDAVERDRRRREGEMDTDILLWAAARSKLEAYQVAQEARVPAAFMADARDVVESPQLAARRYFRSVEHPRAGQLVYPGFPAKITGCDWEYTPAPLLGEHTEQVLSGRLGLSPREVDELRAAGVV